LVSEEIVVVRNSDERRESDPSDAVVDDLAAAIRAATFGTERCG
jgi:hypothetical protein